MVYVVLISLRISDIVNLLTIHVVYLGPVNNFQKLFFNVAKCKRCCFFQLIMSL